MLMQKFLIYTITSVISANALGDHIHGEPDKWLRHTFPLDEIEVGSYQNPPVSG